MRAGGALLSFSSFLRAVVLLLAVLPCALARAQDARALRGVALVIGNSAYEHLSALPNPANDARAVEGLLNDLGFETELSSDRDGRRLARDLRDFVEDAEGADVAVVYYAGHGIEAGGENFLVPVDADLSALEAAGERLVPISSFIAELQATVPVTIVMLDACRDNPFPAGATVRLDVSAHPLPMGEGGLGETRGATRLAPSPTQTESYGTVIAFAAEPGRVALDGEPGGNSPYTAAVLRHFDAMAGEEFGTVMRMVAEEVYLKTGGAQRPWVNESLRRKLYFGRAPAHLEEDQEAILQSRRHLLLSIVDLHESERQQIKSIAAENGVPMDAIFGILTALGQDAPEDPAQLEQLLQEQAQRVKALLAERDILIEGDPEMARLNALADQAISEGALEAGGRLLERSKARIEQLRATLDQAQSGAARLRDDFIDVYLRSAMVDELAFEYASAAATFAQAAEIVAESDPRRSMDYQIARMRALVADGRYRGNVGSLRAVIGLAQETAFQADAIPDKARGVLALQQGALASLAIGRNDTDADALIAARTVLEFTLKAHEELASEALAKGRHYDPDIKVEASVALAETLFELGKREGSITLLKQAERQMPYLTAYSRPTDNGLMNLKRGDILLEIGRRGLDADSSTALFGAIQAYRSALGFVSRDRSPFLWSQIQTALSDALVADTEDDAFDQRLLDAVAGYRSAIEILPKDRMQVQWLRTNIGLGLALKAQGLANGSIETLTEAHDTLKAAHNEIDPTSLPVDWRRTWRYMADVDVEIGILKKDKWKILGAAHLYGLLLDTFSKEEFPVEWAITSINLARSLIIQGFLETTTPPIDQAVAILGSVEPALDPKTQAKLVAALRFNLIDAYRELGKIEDSKDNLRKARVVAEQGFDETFPVSTRISTLFMDQMLALDELISGQ